MELLDGSQEFLKARVLSERFEDRVQGEIRSGEGGRNAQGGLQMLDR